MATRNPGSGCPPCPTDNPGGAGSSTRCGSGPGALRDGTTPKSQSVAGDRDVEYEALRDRLSRSSALATAAPGIGRQGGQGPQRPFQRGGRRRRQGTGGGRSHQAGQDLAGCGLHYPRSPPLPIGRAAGRSPIQRATPKAPVYMTTRPRTSSGARLLGGPDGRLIAGYLDRIGGRVRQQVAGTGVVCPDPGLHMRNWPGSQWIEDQDRQTCLQTVRAGL